MSTKTLDRSPLINSGKEKTMQIAITGSTGLVGSKLAESLRAEGHEVLSVSRRSPENSAGSGPSFDPEGGESPSDPFENLDAVIHLAGEGIANKRWSSEQKKKIRDSRVLGTRSLCEALAKCKNPPKTLISASAIGFYGNREDEELTEESSMGTGFLSETCHEWEQSSSAAKEAGIRVVHIRIGLVLSPDGGALAKMLPPFKMFVGGKIGSGQQYMSWISLHDLVRAIEFCLSHEEMSGPVNGVAPNPLTNSQFTQYLGKALNRPTLFPLPGFMAKLMLGEMAQDLLLNGQKVLPKKLENHGFKWDHETLDQGLAWCLQK